MRMRVLAGMLLAVSAFAADKGPGMSNYQVFLLTKQGVTEQDLIARINTNPVEFDVSPEKLAELRRNGVSDSIINAMVARVGRDDEARRPRSAFDSRRERESLRSPKEPTVKTPKERPAYWGMTPGMPELGTTAGVSYGIASEIKDTSIPDVRLSNIALEGAIGINRYFAGVGTFARHGIGGFSGCLNSRDCVDVHGNASELLGGVKYSMSNSSRVTPFVTAQAGALHVSVGADGDLGSFQIGHRTYNIKDGASFSIWTPVSVFGGGGDFHASRNVGAEWRHSSCTSCKPDGSAVPVLVCSTDSAASILSGNE
jgi:hypothetical protein